jgi:hypothetical protein
MAGRHPVGIALALATGVAIGYAVSPSAQGVVTVQAPPTPYQEIQLRVEPLGSDRVQVTVNANDGFTFTGKQVNLSIDQNRLIVRPLSETVLGRVYELPRR